MIDDNHRLRGRLGKPSSSRSRGAPIRRAALLLGLSGLVVLAACARDGSTSELGTAPGSTEGSGACVAPVVTGRGDAPQYPETLDDMVRSSDLVVEGVFGPELGTPEAVGTAWVLVQPMRFTVEKVYFGEPPDDLTVGRLETTQSVTGEPGESLAAWAGEPWFCSGDRYILFLHRSSTGTAVPVSRVGAIAIAPTEVTPSASLFPTYDSLVQLAPDQLRSELDASVGRVAGPDTTVVPSP
jgi:hypothetical protein